MSKAIDKNLNKYLEEKPDISQYKELYKFNNDLDILKSFNKVFNDYNLVYKPRSNTRKVNIQYLLSKIEKSKKIPRNLFEYFDTSLKNKKKLNLKFDIDRQYDNIETDESEIISDDSIIPIQSGDGLNNIKIDENSLNKNILKIRYFNGRKLNNKLLKYDYKISKNMKDAIKFNKNIHKLSLNEKNIYYELEKYINKDKSLDVLIGVTYPEIIIKNYLTELIKFYTINIKII